MLLVLFSIQSFAWLVSEELFLVLKKLAFVVPVANIRLCVLVALLLASLQSLSALISLFYVSMFSHCLLLLLIRTSSKTGKHTELLNSVSRPFAISQPVSVVFAYS